CRVAECFENDSVAGGVEFLEIIDDLVPGGEFPILAGREAEDFSGRRDLFLGRGDSSHEKEQQQCDYSCAHGFRQFIKKVSPAKAQRRKACRAPSYFLCVFASL